MTLRERSSVHKIMVIEDNAGDVGLLKELASRWQNPCSLDIVSDGESALARLDCLRRDPEQRLPDLILLDLKLPGKDGIEVTRRLKSDARYRMIPIIIFSTSKAASDIQHAYQAHANCYLVKPPHLSELERMLEKLKAFWLETARLPGT